MDNRHAGRVRPCPVGVCLPRRYRPSFRRALRLSCPRHGCLSRSVSAHGGDDHTVPGMVVRRYRTTNHDSYGDHAPRHARPDGHPIPLHFRPERHHVLLRLFQRLFHGSTGSSQSNDNRRSNRTAACGARHGIGSQAQKILGRVVIGGMLTTAVLILVVLPVLYELVYRR